MIQNRFNPLKIGSYCNEVESVIGVLKTVSIPLKSGRIVITRPETAPTNLEVFQSP